MGVSEKCRQPKCGTSIESREEEEESANVGNEETKGRENDLSVSL